jgi:hypothetical protein
VNHKYGNQATNFSSLLEQLIFMMELIEVFIKRAFISKNAATQLEKNIPPRETRPKS